jgi:hypothetical protein
MTWLALVWALQIGYVPMQQVDVWGPQWGNWHVPESATEVTMEAAVVLFDHVEIGGMLKSYQTPTGPGAFMPFRMDYGIHADIVFKNETSSVRLGIMHECDHSITLGFFLPPPSPLAMAQTEMYLRFEQRLAFK